MNKKLYESLVLSISEKLRTYREYGLEITAPEVQKVVSREIARHIEDFPQLTVEESDKEALVFDISNIFLIKTDEELIAISDDNVQRWLDSERDSIKWTHWNAYTNMLKKQGRPEDTIISNEEVIDAVLDLSGDPSTPGNWSRRGLVMGNVQSGKTQNYIGLINKAIDCGYKTIILLGGHLNDLRKQTQERVDEGVLGRESKHLINAKKGPTKPIGVGEFQINTINSGTTTMGDFTKDFANKLGFSLEGSDPVIFTIKKHSGMMKRLFEWVRDHHFLDVDNNKLLNGPLLLIDDEADYATINTKHHREEITSTNSGIRNILSLFTKSTYVGYTATPFANIFIDPDDNTYSDKDDLFPTDFMVKIPAPNNYMGQNYYFIDQTDALIHLEHDNPLYELKSKDEITFIPESLKSAVRAFVIVCSVRAFRGQGKSHNSMLVNVSHLKVHQDKLELLIDEYFNELKAAFGAYSGLGFLQARKNKLLKELEDTFYEVFDIKQNYSNVFSEMTAAFNKIKVWAINQSKGKNEKVLDYSSNKDNGLNVIVIGGHKLSRGLTLEGLSISYFARNSKAYDTLMQMCRWFGYRPRYDDLCKVYMSEESESWYCFIANAIDELYRELHIMKERGLKPKDFGLKVREHPGAMIVTAKNKIGAAISETRLQDLWGQVLRRFRFSVDKLNNERALIYTENFWKKLYNQKSKGKNSIEKDADSGSIILKNVDYDDVIKFIIDMNLPEDEIGNKALIHQLSEMNSDKSFPKFRVALFNQKATRKTKWEDEFDHPQSKDFINKKYAFAGEYLTLLKRELFSDGRYLSKPSVNLGNSDDEKIFLNDAEKEIVANKFKDKNKKAVSYDYIASKQRDYPTLIIYLFAVAAKDKKSKSYILPHGLNPTVGFTIAIPRPEHLKDKSQDELKKLIKRTKHSYKLNAVAQRINIVEEYTDE